MQNQQKNYERSQDRDDGERYIGIGLGVAICAFSVSSFLMLPYLNYKSIRAEQEIELTKVNKGYITQERDLNGNGIPEKFIEVGGKN